VKLESKSATDVSSSFRFGRRVISMRPVWRDWLSLQDGSAVLSANYRFHSALTFGVNVLVGARRAQTRPQ
jgi:hypothetical protein